MSPSEHSSSSLGEPDDGARTGLEPPLAAASRRLNSDLTGPRRKLGRPRKTVEADQGAFRTSQKPQLGPEDAENGRTLALPHHDADGSRLVGVRDAGAFLGVSPWTVRDLIRAGHLPRVVLPLGRWRLHVRRPKAFQASRRCSTSRSRRTPSSGTCAAAR